MSEVQVGELTIKQVEQSFERVHPAIGTVGDTAYVGVWIHCQVTGVKENRAFKDLLWLVTSNRKQILANDECLRPLGWRLAYKPIRFLNRWSLTGVRKFLEGMTVGPNQLLEKLISVYRKYLEFQDERDYIFHVLWDVGTYFAHMFNAFPYLYVGGTKRVGKTKTLLIHSCLAHNAFFSNNMSTSSLFRLIQNARGTLLIDETEKLSYRNMSERTLEIRSILLSGYKKGGKCYRVEKTKKGVLHPQDFEVYAPKALANIQGLEDVLEDRCKPTIIRRSQNKLIINAEPDINATTWIHLRDDLYVFFMSYWRRVKACYDELGESSELVNLKVNTGFSDDDLSLISGRELELWRPILALAVFFDKKYLSENKFTTSLGSSCSLTSSMLELAVEDARQRNTENMTETGEAILVQVLTTIVNSDDFYSVKHVKETMTRQFDEEQKWLTTRWIGSALRRLGFKEKRRVGTGYQYKLCRGDVDDLAERMQVTRAPAPSVESSQEETKKEKGSGSLRFSADDVLRLERVGPGFEDKCVWCGFNGRMDFQMTAHDGSQGLLCEDCGLKLSARMENP